ncbi:hypothetical protein [Escherichia coli]|uniref:hypothetical protein n=1 Tax=Escherichia coli TaxID=562 RepID=UPI000DA4C77C|nr:hypothetical protein [Escherichia coli]SQS47038.1 phage protein [Escherichia coli]
MNRKQKQELQYFLRKEIASLEDVESQSSDIPFGMDINDARMLQAYRIALAALQAKPAAWSYSSGKINIPVITTCSEIAESWKLQNKYVTPLYPAPYSNNNHKDGE